jgi:hypothetical protein
MNIDTMRDRLAHKLLVQRPAMLNAERYFVGDQPTGYLDPEVTRVTDGRVRNLPVNYARLAIDAVAQRTKVTGFRSSPGEVVDAELQALWQDNSMDEQGQLAQADALVHGRSFFLTWVRPDGSPSITAESPLQMVVERDPLTLRIIAALKRWSDFDGYTRSLLFTEDYVTEYVSTSAINPDPMFAQVTPNLISDDAVMVRQDVNPLGLVPVTALVNRPRLRFPDGESDLTDLLPIIDALGKILSDMMVASEYAAAPKRYVSNMFPGTNAANQEAMKELALKVREEWESQRASKFILASGDAKFGSFETAPLDNFNTAVSLLTGQIAALASLPGYWVQGNTANPTSADAIRSSEARLTAKVRQRQAWWSGPYEDLMRMAVTIRDGVADPRLSDLVTLWHDPEPATVAQTADATQKVYAAGIIDRRTALEDLGYDPQTIDRMLQSAPDQPIA